MERKETRMKDAISGEQVNEFPELVQFDQARPTKVNEGPVTMLTSPLKLAVIALS